MQDPYPTPNGPGLVKEGGSGTPPVPAGVEPQAITYTNIPTGWDAAKLNEAFSKLVAKADENWNNIVHAYVPEYLQPNLAQYLAAAAPPVTGPGNALVVDQQVINLTSPAGASVKLTVVNSAITAAVLTLPGTQAIVANGATVAISGQATNGTLAVAGNAVTGQSIPATQHVVKNGDAIVVHDAADANVPGSPGTATVAAGALSKVNLTV